MRILHSLSILIVFIFHTFYVFADLNEGYAFRSLDINNGLSQNTVHAILQDKQGFMWFGTKDGLDRYDGISFRAFMKESGTLGNNFITSLYEDQQGQIWIGTDVGLYVYSPEHETVERFIMKSDLDTGIDYTVNLVTGDKDGGIWVVTQSQAVFYYNPQTNKLINYLSDQSGRLKFGSLGQLYFIRIMYVGWIYVMATCIFQRTNSKPWSRYFLKMEMNLSKENIYANYFPVLIIVCMSGP